MIELFSNREIAMGIWTSIILLLLFFLAVRSTSARQSIYDVIRAATNKYIIIFFFTTIAYSIIWIKLASIFPFWDWNFLKSIIFWVLFVGVPICFNAVEKKSESYLWDMVKSNFKLVIFVEFLVGTFTFSIVTELLLLPIATLLLLLNTIAATDKSYNPAEKLFSFLQVILGFTILYFAIKNVIHHYVELNSIDTFIAFIIPIIMTLIFLPLAYTFVIYSGYEYLFKMMKFRLPKDKKNRGRVKWGIFRSCKLSIEKVDIFKANYLKKIYSTMDEDDINRVFKSFRSSDTSR